MAAVAGHRTKGIRASTLTGLDKENISPKKTRAQQKYKKTQDVNGIFNYEQRMAQKHGITDRTREALSPKFAGINKPSPSKPGYFTRMNEKRALNEERARASAKKVASTPDEEIVLEYAQRQKQQAMSFGFADTIMPYIATTTDAWTTRMKDQHKQLDSIRRGVDYKTGKPLRKPGHPTNDQVAALMKELEELDRPFEDDEVTLHFRNSDGSTSVKPTRIGTIVDKFTKSRKKQEAIMKQHERDLKTIEQEIEELRQEISDDTSAGEKADKDFEKQMKAFEKERKEIEAQAKAERAALKEEEKRRTDEMNKKIRELLALTAD